MTRVSIGVAGEGLLRQCAASRAVRRPLREGNCPAVHSTPCRNAGDLRSKVEGATLQAAPRGSAAVLNARRDGAGTAEANQAEVACV